MHETSTSASVPREVAPGVFWLPMCSVMKSKDRIFHGHNSSYLLVGNSKSLLIDTGRAKDWPMMRARMRQVLQNRGLDFILPTHPEVPHMGNIYSLLEEFPESIVVGDLRNYHLYLPDHVDRLQYMTVGEVIDLGGETVALVKAVLHDLPNTLWAYTSKSKVLFTADGFAFSHSHLAGECDLTSAELPTLPGAEDAAQVINNALSWSRYVHRDHFLRDLHQVLADHPVEYIGPTHGSFITNPRVMLPVVEEGLLRAREWFS